jgi:ankyrin repeat protein
MVRFLIDKGLPVNDPGLNNYTPLNFAACGGHLEVVKMLVTAGADPKIPDMDGITPLESILWMQPENYSAIRTILYEALRRGNAVHVNVGPKSSAIGLDSCSTD